MRITANLFPANQRRSRFKTSFAVYRLTEAPRTYGVFCYLNHDLTKVIAVDGWISDAQCLADLLYVEEAKRTDDTFAQWLNERFPGAICEIHCHDILEIAA